MPVDFAGNTLNQAYELGQLGGFSSSPSCEAIAGADLHDYYHFKVAGRGRVSLSLTGRSDNTNATSNETLLSRRLKPNTYYVKLVRHTLIALTCSTVFSSLLASPAQAAAACSVATRDRSHLSVYERPNEELLINALRFGRKVDIKDAVQDSQGRAWVKIAGDYNGEYRQWGWVIRQYLGCGGQATATKGKKIVTVYGDMACPATVRMLQQLSQNKIPHVFKDINEASNNEERHQRAQKIPETEKRSHIPVVYINKNQWTRIGPGSEAVIEAYRNN